MVNFERNCLCVFQSCCTILSPTISVWSSSFSTFSSTFGFVTLLKFSHYRRWELVSDCGFYLYFPEDQGCREFVHVLIGYSLVKYLLKTIVHIFKVVIYLNFIYLMKLCIYLKLYIYFKFMYLMKYSLFCLFLV